MGPTTTGRSPPPSPSPTAVAIQLGSSSAPDPIRLATLRPEWLVESTFTGSETLRLVTRQDLISSSTVPKMPGFKETFAFLWNWSKEADYPNSAPWKECLNSQATAAYNTSPIPEAGWAAVYVEPTPEPTPDPEVPDTNNNTDDDHSFKTTASATALLGAVYALAF